SMEAPVDAVRDIGRSSGVPCVEGRSSVSRSDMECLHDRYYRGPEDHDEERREDEENHGKEHLDRSGTRLFFRELTAAHAYLARELSERTRKRYTQRVGLDDRGCHARGRRKRGSPRKLAQREPPCA